MNKLWEQYTNGKQTYLQLSKIYNCSIRTIQRKIDTISIHKNQLESTAVVVLMDTTYFKRRFGVVCFKDSISKKFLYKKYVKNEVNLDYFEGLDHLKDKGYSIQAVVCDGRRGVIQKLSNIPVQMCQFHQIQIVTRYLTKNPKLEASIELKLIVKDITTSTKRDFTAKLNHWITKWEGFYNERTPKEKGKKRGHINFLGIRQKV